MHLWEIKDPTYPSMSFAYSAHWSYMSHDVTKGFLDSIVQFLLKADMKSYIPLETAAIFFLANIRPSSLTYKRQFKTSTQVLLCLFPGVLWLWHFLYSVGPASSVRPPYIHFRCRGHSWRVRLAKLKTLTPSEHLVSPLVCRGPWMSIVVLYCWCHSDGASVLLYFTLYSRIHVLLCYL